YRQTSPAARSTLPETGLKRTVTAPFASAIAGCIASKNRSGVASSERCARTLAPAGDVESATISHCGSPPPPAFTIVQSIGGEPIGMPSKSTTSARAAANGSSASNGKTLMTPSLAEDLASQRVYALEHLFPVDVVEERVDVLRRGCAEVHVIRVLVHVHDEQRRRRGRRMHVVGHPVVLGRAELAVVAEDHPARAAAQTGGHAAEL